MKRFLIYTIMAVLAAGVAPAQENEDELLLTGDLSLFDVRGPVKAITRSTCASTAKAASHRIATATTRNSSPST